MVSFLHLHSSYLPKYWKEHTQISSFPHNNCVRWVTLWQCHTVNFMAQIPPFVSFVSLFPGMVSPADLYCSLPQLSDPNQWKVGLDCGQNISAWTWEWMFPFRSTKRMQKHLTHRCLSSSPWIFQTYLSHMAHMNSSRTIPIVLQFCKLVGVLGQIRL